MTHAQTLQQQMNYPTHTFIRNLVLSNLVGQFKKQLDHSSVMEVIYGEMEAESEGTQEGNDLIKNIVSTFDLDLDDIVYDQISNFDGVFENDPNWFCDMEDEDNIFDDEKDRIRDEVLELIGW